MNTTTALHTPGPWHVLRTPFWSNTRVIINEDETLAVGQATFAGMSDTFERCRPEEDEGNALLMAAAPEMLNLLRESERLFSNFEHGKYPDEEHHRANIITLLEKIGGQPESATLTRFRASAVRSLDAVKHCFDVMTRKEMEVDHILRNTTCDKWSVPDMNTIINADMRINNPIVPR